MAVANPVATATIVNAAFLQEVKESNQELWSVLNRLRSIEYDEEQSKERSRLLVNLLTELRDAIGLEFSLEETYGFIQGVPGDRCVGMADANKAKMQHRELYLQLHEICEQAEEAQYRGTIGRDLPIYLGAFSQFDETFRAHESFESDLIRDGLGLARFDPATS